MECLKISEKQNNQDLNLNLESLEDRREFLCLEFAKKMSKE